MGAGRHRVDVFLAPGQLAVRSGAINIKTIVGSCVAVCLWDPQCRVGGVNHYLLPYPAATDAADNRFGSVAVTELIRQMRRAGAVLDRLEAAVIGGGSPVDVLSTSTVGAQNTAVALAVLREHGIRIVRQETGGAHGRKLLFNPQTGTLLVRNVRGMAEVRKEKATR